MLMEPLNKPFEMVKCDLVLVFGAANFELLKEVNKHERNGLLVRVAELVVCLLALRDGLPVQDRHEVVHEPTEYCVGAERLDIVDLRLQAAQHRARIWPLPRRQHISDNILTFLAKQIVLFEILIFEQLLEDAVHLVQQR